MKNILLQVKTDSVVSENISNVESSSLSIWFWIAIVELLIIALLLWKLSSKKS